MSRQYILMGWLGRKPVVLHLKRGNRQAEKTRCDCGRKLFSRTEGSTGQCANCRAKVTGAVG